MTLAAARVTADGGVIGSALLDGVIEDRRVRGQARDRGLVDVAFQPSAVQQVTCDVVEPETLPQAVETSGRVHGLTSGALGSPSPSRPALVAGLPASVEWRYQITVASFDVVSDPGS